ncbi:hypothetical protein SP19_122 [Salmonella phage 19]|nr:hypothetical protein SP19_122 [Salmonella phage 19]
MTMKSDSLSLRACIALDYHAVMEQARMQAWCRYEDIIVTDIARATEW